MENEKENTLFALSQNSKSLVLNFEAIEAEEIDVFIYNVQGQKVKEISNLASGTIHQIQIGDIPPGIYLINLTNRKDLNFKDKFIILK